MSIRSVANNIRCSTCDEEVTPHNRLTRLSSTRHGAACGHRTAASEPSGLDSERACVRVLCPVGYRDSQTVQDASPQGDPSAEHQLALRRRVRS